MRSPNAVKPPMRTGTLMGDIDMMVVMGDGSGEILGLRELPRSLCTRSSADGGGGRVGDSGSP